MNKEKRSLPIGYLLERTTRVVKLNFRKKFTELGIDLTPEQWVILDSLSKNPGMLQKDLADSSFKDAPTISRILDILSKKQLIERKPHSTDKRAHQIILTQQGQSLYNTVKPEVDGLRAIGWDSLSEKDYDQFVNIIDRIFENYSS